MKRFFNFNQHDGEQGMEEASDGDYVLLADVKALVNAQVQSHAIARDRAAQAGRDVVASHRQSNVETCEAILKRLDE